MPVDTATQHCGAQAIRASMQDVVGWDVVNWSRAVQFWESKLRLSGSGWKALELGCGTTGGLTLWLASQGVDVVCSDYRGVRDCVRAVHSRYQCSSRISYADIDATSIPFEHEFDIVAFKSMLGGIDGDGEHDAAEQVIHEVRKALKPGGVLLLAENLRSTLVHHVLRRRFGASKRIRLRWQTNDWRYFSIQEIARLLGRFAATDLQTFGFAGCFGRTEAQRRILGYLDRAFFDRCVPPGWNYIVAAVARK